MESTRFSKTFTIARSASSRQDLADERIGRKEFNNYIYVNCQEQHAAVSKIFKQDFEPERIVEALSSLTRKSFNGVNTLIILDEIQEIDEAMLSLKYFAESSTPYPLMVSGSNLGVSSNQGRSYPVGKVQDLVIRPMNFVEFLFAHGYNNFAEYIMYDEWSKISPFHDNLLELAKKIHDSWRDAGSCQRIL